MWELQGRAGGTPWLWEAALWGPVPVLSSPNTRLWHRTGPVQKVKQRQDDRGQEHGRRELWLPAEPPRPNIQQLGELGMGGQRSSPHGEGITETPGSGPWKMGSQRNSSHGRRGPGPASSELPVLPEAQEPSS